MDAALLQRIDFLRLANNLSNERKIIHNLLMLFITSTTESLAKMEQAEKSRNVLIWLQVAHQIKGAAKNITAQRLAVLCEEAEMIQSLPHPQSANVIYNFHKELALLQIAIGMYLRSAR